MRGLRAIVPVVVTMLGLFLMGCGGSSSNPNPPPSSVTVSLSPPPPSTLVASAQTGVTAVVSNDSANAGVRWSVSCGSSGACGSFSAATTASGASTTYTAPGAVPSGNTVTVTATSVTDSTKMATATITITAAPPAAILGDGTYVYHLAGQNGNGPCFFAGAFTVASGAVTGGEQDFSDSKNGYSKNAITASGSSLSAAGGNIQIVLATSNTSIGVNGAITLRGTKVSGSRVLLSEFDSFATGSGAMDVQTSTAAPSGGYVFLVSGVDLGTTTTPLALGGVLNVSGTTVQVNSSVFDYNFGGSDIQEGLTFASGTVSAPDNFGRVSFSLTPSSATGIPGFILTGYIVGAGQIQLIESEQDALGDNLGGMALGQGANTGTFSQASVSGKTYVYGSAGVDANGLAQLAGKFTMNPNGTLAGDLSLNDLSIYGSDVINAGSYTVNSNGRVTLTGITSPSLDATLAFNLYLDGSGNALVMGADDVEVTAGPGYLQTASSGSFQGKYALAGVGFLNNNDLPPWSAVGPVTVSSNSFTGFTDYNDEGTAKANVTLSGTENSTDGTLNLTGLNGLQPSGSTNFAYYPIDDKRVIAIGVDLSLLGLMTMETVSQ